MRSIKLHTQVAVEPQTFRIGYDDPVMLMGSCFADKMGRRMAELGFRAMTNPFGILYNPLSMAEALSYCLYDRRIGEEEMVERDGLWHSWLHHGSFSRHDRQDCIESCNDAIAEAHSFLLSCNTLIITFGSAWHYRLRTTGKVVANCHKVPSVEFEKGLASIDEVVDAWRPLVALLTAKGVRIIFTVSPVRHQAYGAHGNQLGKAVLLLAIERLVEQTGDMARECAADVSYFPAYEIVVDELRDYRFYADDMAHPSPLAEQLVWQRFQETFMTDETVSRCEEAEKALRRSAHRPLHELSNC